MKKIFTFTLSILFTLPIIASATTFTELPDMELGFTGSPVVEVQKFLNTNGYTVNEVAGEPGSVGYEGTYFGKLTQKALSLFQTKNNIVPMSGYFGAKTKAVFDEHVLKTSEEGNLSSSSGPASISETMEIQENSKKSAYANPAYTITVNHYKDGKYFTSQYYIYPTYSSFTFTYTLGWKKEVVDHYGDFVKWGGICSGTKGNVCVFTIWGTSGNRTIEVYSKSKLYTLTTETKGRGSISGTDGIKENQTKKYKFGTKVSLKQIASKDHTFGGWSGACSGKKDCIIKMDSDKKVVAEFVKENMCTKKQYDEWLRVTTELQKVRDLNAKLAAQNESLQEKINKTEEEIAKLAKTKKSLKELQKERDALAKYAEDLSKCEQGVVY